MEFNLSEKIGFEGTYHEAFGIDDVKEFIKRLKDWKVEQKVINISKGVEEYVEYINIPISVLEQLAGDRLNG